MVQGAGFHACGATVSCSAKEINGVKLVGVVLFDGFSLLGVGAVAEALHGANEMQPELADQGVHYSIRYMSVHGGAVACSSSLCVWTERLGGQRFSGFDALFVAGGDGVSRAAADESLIDLLRIVCSQSGIVNPLGEGHILLSAAGLTRSDWASVVGDNSAREKIRAMPTHEHDEALVSALALVKRDLGSELARLVADRLFIGHDRRLPPTLAHIGATTVPERLRESARWLEKNCDDAISIADAASVAGMSERTFLRHFRREVGITPSEYLLRARLSHSCRLLAESDLPIDKIARRSGLSSGERLSRVFRKHLSLSPTEFRRRTRSPSPGDDYPRRQNSCRL